MFAPWVLALTVALTSLPPSPGQQEQARGDKKTGYVRVEIMGVLKAGDGKEPWSVQVSPDGIGGFSYPLSFSAKHAMAGDLERTARGLRNKMVVLTGELWYTPPMPIKPLAFSTDSWLPPAQCPGSILVIVESLREAVQK
jgi:hypothetical protein